MKCQNNCKDLLGLLANDTNGFISNEKIGHCEAKLLTRQYEQRNEQRKRYKSTTAGNYIPNNSDEYFQ